MGTRFMSGWKTQSPDGLFWAGVVFLLFGAFGVYFGKAPNRGRAIDREKNPKQFWLAIAFYYLCGAICVRIR
jgi:hypothetical protein